jgi:hypothetical protein
MKTLLARLRKNASSIVRHAVVTFLAAVLAVVGPALNAGHGDWPALAKAGAAAGLAAVLRAVWLGLDTGAPGWESALTSDAATLVLHLHGDGPVNVNPPAALSVPLPAVETPTDPVLPVVVSEAPVAVVAPAATPLVTE